MESHRRASQDCCGLPWQSEQCRRLRCRHTGLAVVSPAGGWSVPRRVSTPVITTGAPEVLDGFAQGTALHAERAGRVGQCRTPVGRSRGELPLQHPVVLHPQASAAQSIRMSTTCFASSSSRSTPAVVEVAGDVFFLSAAPRS